MYVAPNLATTSVTEGEPWGFLVPDSDNYLKQWDKKKRRAYVATDACSWQVYSPVAGLNPGEIVSDVNPASVQTGFVVDYDTVISPDEAEKIFMQQPAGKRPTEVEQTLSNKLRLMWRFARPVLHPSPAFAVEFQKQLCDDLGAATLLPGYDIASLKPTQRWTNGGQWWHTGEPALTHEFLVGATIATAERSKLFDRGQIPMADIAAEVQKRFPGRWEGPFEVDKTGVRFWDPKADNPTGCQVKPDGMLCFTGREGFMKWEQLLGKDWCDSRRTLLFAEAAKDIFEVGNDYWEKVRDKWETYQKTQIENHLVGRGLSPKVPKGESRSDVDKVMEYIDYHQKLSGVAPFVNYPPGLIQIRSKQYLNIAQLEHVQAVPGPTGDIATDAALIYDVLWHMFAHQGETHNGRVLDPLNTFLTWLKQSTTSITNYKPIVGQAIFMCGPVNSGKTLLANHLVGPLCAAPPSMAGDAMRYILGQTSFNKSLFDYPIVVINDQDAPKNEGERLKMMAKIKEFVVNPSHAYHAKFCDEITILWMGRIFITLNMDPASVAQLIEVNQNTHDKVMFFQIREYYRQWPESLVIESEFARTLPYFKHWLMYVYEPPANVLSTEYRSGIISYHDPDLLRISQQQHPAYNFKELIATWMKLSTVFQDPTIFEWTGTPTDLKTEMASTDGIKDVCRDYTSPQIAKHLTTLARLHNSGVTLKDDGARLFTLNRTLIAS